MDIRKYLTEEIRKCRRRMNLAKLLDYGTVFAAAGGVLGMGCELVSLIRPFYHAHLAAVMCFAAGLLAGIGYAVYRRADMKQAAGRLDGFGLKERMLTAYEWMEKPEEEAGNAFVMLQRQDAYDCYRQNREKIRIPILPQRRHMLALLLSAAVVIGLGLIPSPVRERAELLHQVQEQAGEEQEQLEELLEALEGVDMDSLTEEQRQALQELTELLQRSREELAGADSWESLALATERLDYKYEQAGQSLEQLAGQLEDPAGAGIATAEAMAQAAANQAGLQTASAGTPSAGGGNTGSGSGGDGGSGGDDGLGDGTGENGNSQGGNSSGTGSGSGEGNGSGESSGSGEGSGSGGDAQGNGGGSGEGGGTGAGRGTGSSNTAHDYVSVPNAVADDPSLTGEKTGDQDSEYYRQQNGLAWEGEHVDYNTVIGEYTDNAYEGLTSGRYPSGMESVIRDYFEKLNQ